MALTAQPHLPKFPTHLTPRAVSPHHHAEKRCEKRCQRLAINPDPLDTDPDDCEFDHVHCLRLRCSFLQDRLHGLGNSRKAQGLREPECGRESTVQSESPQFFRWETMSV